MPDLSRAFRSSVNHELEAERHPAFHGYQTALEIKRTLTKAGEWFICKVDRGEPNFDLFICVRTDTEKIMKLKLFTKSKEIHCSVTESTDEDRISDRPKKESKMGKTKEEQIDTHTQKVKRLPQKKFHSLNDLVDHYKKTNLPGGIRLVYQLNRPEWMLPIGFLNFSKSSHIGEGFFSLVYKGKYTQKRGHHDKVLDCAVKVCIDDEFGKEPTRTAVRESLQREGMILDDLKKCSRITCFYGICTREPFMALVIEYCAGGSLLAHLLNQGPTIVFKEKVYYLREISKGMEYIHAHGYLHLDLAARNCLIATNGRIKIADFGLACSTKNIPNIMFPHFPMKWMPPESLCKSPKFSTKSDVWAFGMLMYEVFNNGLEPWPKEGNWKAVGKYIRDGKMVEMPEETPPQVKKLSANIWKKNPAERPEFEEIVKNLQGIKKEMPADPGLKDYSIYKLDLVKYVDPQKRVAQESKANAVRRSAREKANKKDEDDNKDEAAK
ncbi:protein tyrosine kinase domain-containing protein [Ditylenchus destructor]|nr:protein tyrosine kinase domain-containing protein [Ditylenchus destructor]